MAHLFRNLGFMFLGLLAAVFIFIPAAYADASEVYTVHVGDSLSVIAEKHGVTVAALQQANNISNTTIYAGKTLTIPSKNVSAATTGTHTVSSGESLYVIGLKYGVSYQEIMRLNNLASHVIYPGQQLRIPTSTTTDRGAATIRTNTPVPPEKLDLLARIISAEARGESYNSQVAVGAVILNRVRSSNFPNSIPEVINQKSSGVYQFSPVANGAINNPATESAKKAALDAVNGADPSNGALYFFESNTKNQWLLAKPVTARISSLVFAK